MDEPGAQTQTNGSGVWEAYFFAIINKLIYIFIYVIIYLDGRFSKAVDDKSIADHLEHLPLDRRGEKDDIPAFKDDILMHKDVLRAADNDGFARLEIREPGDDISELSRTFNYSDVTLNSGNYTVF